jgi:hypothetical protein
MMPANRNLVSGEDQLKGSNYNFVLDGSSKSCQTRLHAATTASPISRSYLHCAGILDAHLTWHGATVPKTAADRQGGSKQRLDPCCKLWLPVTV